MTDPDLERLLRLRGVHPEDACPTCRGVGRRMYSNTSGWRGGIGGAAMTYDVCDACWGSGDAHRPGVDLRSLMAGRASWEAEQALLYLSRAVGADTRTLRGYVSRLADLAEAQTRKRKLPEGVDAFWWNANWNTLAATLRRLVERAEGKNT